MQDTLTQYINTACDAYLQGSYQTAGKMFLEALRKAKVEQNKTHLSLILFNLGLFYRQQRRYKKAIVCLERALSQAPPNDPDAKVRILVALAQLHRLTDKPVRAARSYVNAVETYQNEEDVRPMQLDKIYSGLFSLYYSDRKFTKAESTCKDAIETFSKVRNCEPMVTRWRILLQHCRTIR